MELCNMLVVCIVSPVLEEQRTLCKMKRLGAPLLGILFLVPL